MINVKEYIYKSLEDCGLPLEDTPILNNKNYPYGLLRLINLSDIQYKNYVERRWTFKIDIFSTYAGDQECLKWRNKIVPKVFNDLMSRDGITYVDNAFMLLDDKEQGPVVKHGIITIEVTTTEIEEGGL